MGKVESDTFLELIQAYIMKDTETCVFVNDLDVFTHIRQKGLIKCASYFFVEDSFPIYC